MNTETIMVLVALLAGGVVGAVIAIVVNSYRDRIQSVGHRIDISPVFKQTLGNSSLQTHITVSEGGKDYRFNNLFIANVLIANKGNRDLSEFKFGLTLSRGDQIIYMIPEPPDRHHIVDQGSQTITPAQPKSEIDLTLKPFNRNDSYLLKLYIVVPQGEEQPSRISLSSPEPIKFVSMPTIGEAIASAAQSYIVNLGPFKLSIGPR